jgi:hypothetical protein
MGQRFLKLGERSGRGDGTSGASWNRTSDLSIIRGGRENPAGSRCAPQSANFAANRTSRICGVGWDSSGLGGTCWDRVGTELGQSWDRVGTESATEAASKGVRRYVWVARAEARCPNSGGTSPVMREWTAIQTFRAAPAHDDCDVTMTSADVESIPEDDRFWTFNWRSNEALINPHWSCSLEFELAV